MEVYKVVRASFSSSRITRYENCLLYSHVPSAEAGLAHGDFSSNIDLAKPKSGAPGPGCSKPDYYPGEASYLFMLSGLQF